MPGGNGNSVQIVSQHNLTAECGRRFGRQSLGPGGFVTLREVRQDKQPRTGLGRDPARLPRPRGARYEVRAERVAGDASYTQSACTGAGTCSCSKGFGAACRCRGDRWR